MESQSADKRGIRRKWKRGISGGLGLAAAIGVALMFLGSAAATPVSAAARSVTDKAPFSGTVGLDEFGTLNGFGGPICGVAEKFLMSPAFNLTTGRANESVKATARSCGPGTSFASPEETAGFNSANFTTNSGLHHIKATWDLDLSVRLAATPGSPLQSAYAYFVVTTQLYLDDQTNFTVVSSNNSPYLEVAISSGSFVHSYSKVVQTLYLNATLAKGHIYMFGVYVYLDVYASVSPGTSTASAMGNMGSGGRNAFLTSVSGL